jgi:hypothetical protein
MGTKTDPGPFNCLAAAEPDEPIFILLGRDAHAHAAVRKWADDREAFIKTGAKPVEDMHRVWEARECADKMEAFHIARAAKKRSEALYSAPQTAEDEEYAEHDRLRRSDLSIT